MTRSTLWLVAVLWLGIAAAAGAQTGQQDVPEDTEVPVDTPTLTDTPAAAPEQTVEDTAPSGITGTEPDYDAWALTAARTEAISERGSGSVFALERLRVDLVDWRERFLAAESRNSGRIATVQSQLDALGAPPETGQEAAEVTARREVLTDQLSRLQAPVILSQEAYARANGLIEEVDTLLRDTRTQNLLERGVSPLNPAIWPEAVQVLAGRVLALGREARVTLTSPARWENFVTTGAPAGFLFLIGLVLTLRGRRWGLRVQDSVVSQTGNEEAAGVWRFVLSLLQIVLPFLGLVALEEGAMTSGFVGVQAGVIVDAVPEAGMFAVVALWLRGQLRAADGAGHLLREVQSVRGGKIGKYITRTGWILTIGVLILTFLEAGEASAPAAALVLLPVQLILAYVLYRLGQILVRAAGGEAEEGAEDVRFHRRIFGLVGRAVIVIAAIGPLLAFAGYANATDALIVPAVMTLTLLAITLLVQGFTSDLYGLVLGVSGSSRDALIPVLIGFVLALCAMPLLALIWGATTQDLGEVWARFRDGYSFGETRISPTDFLAFAIVFGLGYMLTRLLQGALRSSILPKTRLDKGAQNAIVAGIGYVGIFLAALIAISSAGLDLSSLAIVAGALSVGIGFGLQNIVSNFVSGIILLIERPISEGDWIEVGGQMGYVKAISVRSTRIETFDRTDVIIPNADLVSGQVTNWTRGNSVGRVIVPVGVAYGTDVDKVSAILQEIAESNPMVVLTPPPSVIFMAFGADSLNFEIRAILRDINFMLTVKSEMNHAINARFAAEGIEIPFAQRDLWLRNPEALKPTPQEG